MVGFELTTGQRILVRVSGEETGGDAVVFESYLPGQAPGLALPPSEAREQRFEVLAGTVGFSIDGAETLLTAGGRLTIPRGTTCTYWNPGAEPSHLVAEVRPALDFEHYLLTRKDHA